MVLTLVKTSYYHRSSNFYLLILLLWLLLCTLPVGYVIASTRPSSKCGPFAKHTHFYTVVTNELEKRVDAAILAYIRHVASPGVVIPILLFLVLIIYFLVSLVRGLREANTDLQQQLIHERTEEKKKIFELAGGGKKKTEKDRERDKRKAQHYLPAIEQKRREPRRVYNQEGSVHASDSSESEEEDQLESPMMLQKISTVQHQVPSSTTETLQIKNFHPSLGSLIEHEDEEDSSRVLVESTQLIQSQSMVLEKDIGTGGEILRAIRNLLGHLHGLKYIDIQGLQLSWNDAQLLMCEVLEKFQQQLLHLNLTLYPSSLLHFGLFLNLRSLTLSPLNLFDNTLQLVSALQKLKHFRIVQDEKSSEAVACTGSAWKDITETNQGRTKVYLIMRGKPKETLIVQPKAPVYAIIMERSCGQITTEVAEQICDNSATLNRFCQLGLERMKRGKQEKDRVDRPIVDISMRCHNLRFLCVRERLSAGTALILVIISRKYGFELHLRQNALLNRISWCRSDLHILGLDINFNWLRKNVKDFKNLDKNIAEVTGLKTTVLSDKRYKDSFK